VVWRLETDVAGRKARQCIVGRDTEG